MRISDWSSDVCSSDLMRVARRFTAAGTEVYDKIEFRRTSREIRNPDGSLVFRADDIEVPTSWSQVASDILAQKYFRKRGLPLQSNRVPEDIVPAWRSEERRLGEECGSKCSTRGTASHKTK